MTFNFSRKKKFDVVCIGNALMDILVEVPEEYLAQHNLVKGGMALVTRADAEKQLTAIADRKVRTLPGGSSANTARGISVLGGKVAFFGSVGKNLYGKIYHSALSRAGVQTHLHEGAELTGNAITYITPDHERTFSVHLGSAVEVPWSSIDSEVIASTKILHLEGYQLEGRTFNTMERAMILVKESGGSVSLDLSDAGLVARERDLFKSIISKYVDILFANEAEASAFVGVEEPLQLIEALKPVAKTVVLKCGADGAQIIVDQVVNTISAESVPVVDTTGAGDLFAAGFLYGITHGYSIIKAGTLGAKASAIIIQEMGVDTELIRGLRE